ncbi:hypothetical protein [Candidatus Poriferisodalis sp.]|uniref:hypothetical protein n=1 Tax=Candidatus Poriferisodalis sp. TaxID=3101277 RepID=UPI003B01D1C1
MAARCDEPGEVSLRYGGPLAPPSRVARRCDERGEVFPVAILFGGVLLTVLLALHMTLFSLARTAASSAAELGLAAAQGTQPGVWPDLADPPSDCAPWTDPVSGDRVAPGNFRECAGILAAWEAMAANDAMVSHARQPDVFVNEDLGVVRVVTYGAVRSPVFGFMEVRGVACGPLDQTLHGGPSAARC